MAFAIQAGAHPKQIQEAMGHASIKTTLDVYGHLFPSLHEAVSDQLDAMYRVTYERANDKAEVTPLTGRPRSV